jgi:hypothetical protein
MKRKLSLFVAAAAPLAIAPIAAGCGSSTGGASYSSQPYGSAVKASAPNGAGAAKVGTADSPLGRIVVDSGGRTLYLFVSAYVRGEFSRVAVGVGVVEGVDGIVWRDLDSQHPRAMLGHLRSSRYSPTMSTS